MSHPARLRRAAARLVVAAMVLGVVGGPVGLAITPTTAVAAPPNGGKQAQAKAKPEAEPKDQPAAADDSSCGVFLEFCQKVSGLKGPGTAIVGTICGVGLLIGGAMLGIGQQSGMRIMALSAAAGAGILIGNGVISVFT